MRVITLVIGKRYDHAGGPWRDHAQAAHPTFVHAMKAAKRPRGLSSRSDEAVHMSLPQQRSALGDFSTPAPALRRGKDSQDSPKPTATTAAGGASTAHEDDCASDERYFTASAVRHAFLTAIAAIVVNHRLSIASLLVCQLEEARHSHFA